MKHLMTLMFLIIGLTALECAKAQSCGYGYYNAAATPPGQQAPAVNCVPIPGYDQQQQPPSAPTPPPPKWVSRWGAIASDFQKGSLGVATNMKSREAAEEAAKADCRANGGVSCMLETWYSNSCAAMVLGDTKHSTNNAPTLNEAIQLGMEKCQRDTTNCEVYYKACSMPDRIR